MIKNTLDLFDKKPQIIKILGEFVILTERQTINFYKYVAKLKLKGTMPLQIFVSV